MLISFSVENWMCFREKLTLSMVATDSEQHRKRVANISDYKLRLLPVAAIYGANASGKTTFLEALNFAIEFVESGNQKQNQNPIASSIEACADQTSTFSFEILSDNEDCYEFSFSVKSEKILEEKLVKITTADNEIVLYARDKDGKINFPKRDMLKEDGRLELVAQSTRDNLLFLTNASNQKITSFDSVYQWFHLNYKLKLFINYLGMNNLRTHEIDRQMKIFLKTHLESCSQKTRSQVIFNTHDTSLIDKKLLRHDEIYVLDRDKKGFYSLIGLGEYEGAAEDKNIRKSYMDGRFGGLLLY